MRLFIAVEPPARVLDVVAALPRPERASTRWTTRDQWHVTLRFLGEVDDPVPVIAALEAMSPPGAIAARLGPRVEALGREVVCVPVSGVDELASSVIDATASIGRPPEHRRFHGHLTLARTRDQSARSLVHTLGKTAIDVEWDVTEIVLVRSTLHPTGATYDAVHRRVLSG